ncbi:MAG: acetyl-CoA carboxylase biotin carboxylase subunit [Candidatus Kapaibacterium sp.]
MINKILIANRSEIACRVIKACKEMGITSVAVYSEIDADALHVKLADECFAIGGTAAKESYLDMDKIIKAALKSGADAIHPGYGFLSENPEFNEKVRNAGLIFIGPNPESMRLLGSKTKARDLMISNSVPVVPGVKSNTSDINEYSHFAEKIGYPVLIKSAAGGGGKGMRVVKSPNELADAIDSAKRESLSAFGSDEIFMEKYIQKPRHIEFQVVGDSHGNYIHLFERECSLQRRHQKIIEEAPSTALDEELRNKMGQAAIQAVKSAGYDNVGTVEFLLDEDGSFYFLEVNARIQVEHPVTEEITGIDLVQLQINIAAGEPIPFNQKDLSINGWSIECRIYAEDAFNDFMPSSGKILLHKAPIGEGVRFDSGIETGTNVSIFYDPILAKLIVNGDTREEATERMIDALKSTAVLGVKTSLPFMIGLLENEIFKNGDTYTGYIDKNYAELIKFDFEGNLPHALGVAAHINTSFEPENKDPWLNIGKWELLFSKGKTK